MWIGIYVHNHKNHWQFQLYACIDNKNQRLLWLILLVYCTANLFGAEKKNKPIMYSNPIKYWKKTARKQNRNEKKTKSILNFKKDCKKERKRKEKKTESKQKPHEKQAKNKDHRC